jgi:hypothetical protein
MRRKASKLVLISTGAALAWFLDPVSGRDRRRQVADQLSALTGGSTAGSDPTGGATPPAVAEVQPLNVQPPPQPTPMRKVDDGDLAQAVEAAHGGEKLLGSSDPAADAAEDEADRNRATLRTTW